MKINQALNHVTRNPSTLSGWVARKLHLAFLLPAMLVVLVSACSGTGTNANQPPNATAAPVGVSAPNTPAATQPPASKSVLLADPRAAVEYALRTQPKAFPFKVTMSIDSGKSQMATTAVVESPQRIMLVDSTHSVIWADGKCYEKTGDAAWAACTDPGTGQIAQSTANSLMDESTINAAISIIKTVKVSGSETLNGIQATIYEYTSSGQLMGMQVDSTTQLWVDESTGLPIKNVTTSTVNGSTTAFTQLIEYGPSIKVQVP